MLGASLINKWRTCTRTLGTRHNENTNSAANRAYEFYLLTVVTVASGTKATQAQAQGLKGPGIGRLRTI